MPVKNIECQLAEMQIGRHVSGEMLSPEALGQLETHLSGCASCARVLADRRSALRSMLHQGYAAVTTDVPTPPKENLLIKALREKAETAANKAPRPATVEASPRQPEPTDKKWNLDSFGLIGERTHTNSPGRAANPANSLKNFTKPLLYAAALSVVIFFMGYFTHGQNSLLGDTAGNLYPNSAEPASGSPKATPAAAKKAATPDPKPATKPSEASQQKVQAKPSPAKTSTVSTKPTSTPAPIATPVQAESSTTNSNPNDASEPQKAPALLTNHPHNISKAAHERHTRRTHHSARPTNHIQVYDENGSPLNGR